MERLVSYAQEGEDVILYHVFKDDIKNGGGGVYIDVGANDPWELSVTKLFYEKGWRGINIEPISDVYEKLVADRPRDINLNIGIGERNEVLTLYQQGVVSSFIKDRALNKFDTTDVQIKTLTDVVKENGFVNQEIHFIKIDVEDFEEAVIKGIDFDVVKPWIFVIEIHSTPTWEQLLLDSGYLFALEFDINRYYVRESKSHLLKRFLPLTKLINLYEIYYVKRDPNFRSIDTLYYRVAKVITYPFRPLFPLILKLLPKKYK